LKWIGPILVVAGVFMMFYLRPYRQPTVGEPITATPAKTHTKNRSPRLEPAVR